MIIDSHAHYVHARYDMEFPYLCEINGNYEVRRANREGLLVQMQKNGIVGFIEPSIGLDAIEKQRALVSSHHNCMCWGAIGVHPTRCIHTPWRKRKKLVEYAECEGIIAIGETGLDYHYPRHKQYRLRQKFWFIYQIKLADRLKLPLVLHIRAADRDALKILKKYRTRLHGGVVHCFGGDYLCAKEYIALGFVLGIGGKLLCNDCEANALRDTIKQANLTDLLIETDAPFVLPDVGELTCSANQRKKLCNSSLILPLIIQKIASIRGEDESIVENTIYENTLRVFGI